MLADAKCSAPSTTNGLREGRRDALGHLGRGALVGDVLEQDPELVASEPSDRVARAQRLAQSRRDVDEQRVARGVAHAVVDELELVEVEEQDGDPRVAPRERVLQPIHEEHPVRQDR